MKLWAKKPKQERSKVVVDSILEATTHVLEAESHDKISTNKIAAKAGVSIGSIYQYFLNKESILDAAFDKKINDNIEFYKKLFDKIDASNLESVIKFLIDNAFEHFVNQKGYLIAIHSVQMVLGKSDTIIKFRLKLADLTADYLVQHFSELGSKEKIKEKVFIILCQNFGVIHMYIHASNSPYTKEQLCESMLKTNLALLNDKS